MRSIKIHNAMIKVMSMCSCGFMGNCEMMVNCCAHYDT